MMLPFLLGNHPKQGTIIEQGLTIGSSEIVLTVSLVTAGGSHVICCIVESMSHKNYIHGSKKVLTMAVEQQV
jgi:hypothetical protein